MNWVRPKTFKRTGNHENGSCTEEIQCFSLICNICMKLHPLINIYIVQISAVGFMIRFGIAGIPLTSKGRTFIESVEDTHTLGLNALEVQLLRVNVEERPALDYAGMRPRDVDSTIIVDVLREDENGTYSGIGIDTVIEEDDIVQELFWNMARNYEDLRDGGELARELDVRLSIHAPYYMELLNQGEMGERSYNHLKWALIIGKAIQAKRVITHTGFYAEPKKDSLKIASRVYTDLSKSYSTESGYPVIGVETSGKSEIFGSVADVIALAKKVKEIEPILNFPHVHSLNGGSLIEVKDFDAVISEFLKFAKGDLYTEFAGVDYTDHTEKKLMAIKHGDLKFETLAESLSALDDDVTVISSSPLLEHDSQYMNLMYLRAVSKKFQKKAQMKKVVG
jgi:deoxyribonuclease-4